MRFLRQLMLMALQVVGVRGALGALAALSLVYVWVVYKPKARPLPATKRYIGQSLVSQVLARIPTDEKLGRVLVLPVEGDWDGFLEENIRGSAQDRGLFEPASDAVWKRIARDIGLSGPPVYDSSSLAQIVAKMDADLALVGKVMDYEETDQMAFGEMNVVLVGRQPESLRTIHVSKTLKKTYLSAEYMTLALRNTSTGQRLLIWFLAVLFFPLIVYPLTALVWLRRNGLANLTMVSVYTAVLIAVTLVILGPANAWWQGLALIGAITLIALYMASSTISLGELARERARRGR